MIWSIENLRLEANDTCEINNRLCDLAVALHHEKDPKQTRQIIRCIKFAGGEFLKVMNGEYDD